MNAETTAIRDVLIITPDTHEDERGFLMESYRKDELAKIGITDEFVQHNHSHSHKRNTIRGHHFQFNPGTAKLMRVIRGSAFLVAVDLRKNSPTLGKWFGVEASEENRKQLYAPESFARGFQTLSDACEVEYLCSSFFDPRKEGNLRWDDPDVAIQWPLKEMPIMSDKDRNAPSLKIWLARPESDFFQY